MRNYLAIILLAFILGVGPLVPLGAAQTYSAHPRANDDDVKPTQTLPDFRLERRPVAGGAELLTIFGKAPRTDKLAAEVPLLSVLRDTLGDDVPENDRLRYVWLLSHKRPSFWQRVASAVPFLYGRVGGNAKVDPQQAPPALADLTGGNSNLLNTILWFSLQNLLLDPTGFAVRNSARTYRRNLAEHRQAQVARALAALSLYQSETKDPAVFTDTEWHDLQAQLTLSDNQLGVLVDDTFYRQAAQQRAVVEKDNRGHNWELLRQRAEAEGLYFEPLQMPDGSATHALLWVAAEDLAKNSKRRWDNRFLNLSNPWKDKKLRQWNGYRETRYYDADSRQVAAGTPNARAVEMIPLAVYGLDHPKIPILLVDFRDNANAKKREISRRLLEDTARGIVSVAAPVFGSLPLFLGRTLYDYVTGRRGADINQPSRLRAYTQLKLLLSLSASLDPDLESEIMRRAEKVPANPLENDAAAEARIARAQYQALIAYANRPDGLPAQLDRDRRAEMVPLKHGKVAQITYKALNVLTFGWYVKRAKVTPELLAKLDLSRRFDYHERFLREVVKSTPRVEVVWDINDVRRSLEFISNNNKFGGKKTAKAVAGIFDRTQDDETRRLCLASLYRINNETAKNELLRIYRATPANAQWHDISAQYLRQSVREAQRIAPNDAKAIVREIGAQ